MSLLTMLGFRINSVCGPELARGRFLILLGQIL